ncbi:uncharacterized protein BJ171DRAFT_86248 [Polychytrium aggregatum]|uniref:uncharacterized protein n=1 Tax=Polychytrium aggregatum TaxID=110093 RepID=UPI0022FF323D|nr:uncharacterized protein BJ171DRAFT_86248 [Polychytrium aggregatum]KAI9190581.1 hypothetical protein BJ171DRAFT_86248 [Polychytrium aggregatum]
MSGMTPEHVFRPKINRVVPDFERLQERFQMTLQKKRNQSTVIEKPPTINVSAIGEPILPTKTMGRSDSGKSGGDQSGQATRHPPPALKAPTALAKETGPKLRVSVAGSTKPKPTKFPVARETHTSALKKECVRQQLDRRVQGELRAKQEEEAKRRRLRELRGKISTRLQTEKTNTAQREQSRIEQFQRDQRQRHHEYREKLREIDSRLDNRRCLFESFPRHQGARSEPPTHERPHPLSFKEILQEAGLDPAEFTTITQ